MASELQTLTDIEASNTLNPVQKQRLDQLRSQGGQGRADGVIQNPGSPVTFNDGGGASSVSGLFGGSSPFDLPSIYKQLYDTSGIKDSQARFDALNQEYQTKEEAKNKALSTINDNPFYSEGTRVGRAAKVNENFNNDTTALSNKQKVLQDQIATQKANIETQLNLQTKQFDINSQQAQLALQRFNSLLTAGALNTASADDIASITRATGLSSQAIQSAINANKIKGYQTTIQNYDDGKSQGFKIITLDQQGNVVNSQSQVVGPSKSANNGDNFDSSNFFSGLMNNQLNLASIDSIIADVEKTINAQKQPTPQPTTNKSTVVNKSVAPNKSVQPPNFAPAGGVGSKYTDKNGIKWTYTRSGWVRS